MHPTALIGDVRASRHHPDQAALFAAIRRALTAVNARLEAAGAPLDQVVALTVGDEFQGVATTLPTALAAAALTQVELLAAGPPEVRVRLGIASGEVLVTDPDDPTRGQSGAAWWAARAAIEAVAAAEDGRDARRATTLHLASDPATDDRVTRVAAVGLDHLVTGLDHVDAALTLALLDARPQATMADRLGISQSTVSRRLQGPSRALAEALSLLLAPPGVPPAT